MTSITVGLLSSAGISVTLRHEFLSWMRYLQQLILRYLRNNKTLRALYTYNFGVCNIL